MKIIVSGGAGFLGTNVALEAMKLGHKVLVFDSFVREGSEDNAKMLKEHGAEIFRGDTRLQQDWDRVSGDAIIHLAGQPGIPASLENPVFDFSVNAIGTLFGLTRARQLGNIPFLYASTNKVYSDEINTVDLKETPTRYKFANKEYFEGVHESFPMDSYGYHPHSPYGVSKASGDLLCQEFYHAFDVPTVVMRMSCIYGLYQHGVSEQGWTDFFVRQRVLGDNKLIFYGNGKQVRDVLFGEDAARAYLMALEHINITRGKVYNLGGGTDFNVSLIEFISILNQYPNAMGTMEPMMIKYDEWRLADHRVYISNTDKIKRDLGWKPEVDVEEGVRRMVEAYKK